MPVSSITNLTPNPPKAGVTERTTGVAAGSSYSEIALQVASFQT